MGRHAWRPFIFIVLIYSFYFYICNLYYTHT